MGILSFFKKREYPIDFREENVDQLIRLTSVLSDILIKAGFGPMADYLSQIQRAASQQDTGAFKKLVISRELFGSAGAIWEIYIEDQQLRTMFDKQFVIYIDLMKTMGIKSGRVNQIRKYLGKVDKK